MVSYTNLVKHVSVNTLTEGTRESSRIVCWFLPAEAMLRVSKLNVGPGFLPPLFLAAYPKVSANSRGMCVENTHGTRDACSKPLGLLDQKVASSIQIAPHVSKATKNCGQNDKRRPEEPQHYTTKGEILADL